MSIQQQVADHRQKLARIEDEIDKKEKEWRASDRQTDRSILEEKIADLNREWERVFATLEGLELMEDREANEDHYRSWREVQDFQKGGH